MEPSSSCVEYHEFLDVLLPPFLSFKQRAECYVKERARRYFRRKFGDGKAEINELGGAKPRPFTRVPYNMLTTKKNSPQDISDSDKPENAKVEQGGV